MAINKPEQQKDGDVAEVQRIVDKENEQGFRGVEVDPTPNENYSVSGVTSGAPTPETDKGAARKATEARADVGSKMDGVAAKKD